MSPLDRLREAVEAFYEEIGAEGTVQGFLLLAQTSVLDLHAPAESPMPISVGEHYTCTLALPAAVGLADGFLHLGRDIIAGSMQANGQR